MSYTSLLCKLSFFITPHLGYCVLFTHDSVMQVLTASSLSLIIKAVFLKKALEKSKIKESSFLGSFVLATSKGVSPCLLLAFTWTPFLIRKGAFSFYLSIK